MYSQDFDEYMPHAWNCGARTPPSWGSAIYPYLKSSDAYRCPDNTRLDDKAQGKTAVAFGYNVGLSRYFQPASPKLSELHAPSNTVLLFELTGVTADVTGKTNQDYTEVGHGGSIPAGDGGCISWGKYDTGNMGQPPRNLQGELDANFPNGRHNGGSNFLLADSHVKWLKPSQVSPGDPPGKDGPPPAGVALSDCAQDQCGGSRWGNSAGTNHMVNGLVATFSPI